MKTVAKPKVFISYTWRPDNPSNPNDKPEERGLKLADRLRAAGLRSTLDALYGAVDGQKFGVERPTVKARHSRKYFGRGKGVVA